MAKSQIDQLKEKGERLGAVRKEIAELEAINKDRIDQLKAERDFLQEQLLEMFAKVGLSSIKTAQKDNISVTRTPSLYVTDMEKAINFAIENKCATVDKRKLETLLKSRKDDLPEGFEFNDREYITFRSAKKTEETTNE